LGLIFGRFSQGLLSGVYFKNAALGVTCKCFLNFARMVVSDRLERCSYPPKIPFSSFRIATREIRFTRLLSSYKWRVRRLQRSRPSECYRFILLPSSKTTFVSERSNYFSSFPACCGCFIRFLPWLPRGCLEHKLYVVEVSRPKLYKSH